MFSDSDIDKWIINYRGRVEEEFGPTIAIELDKALGREFVNPTKDTPVRVAEFLSYLDMEFLDPLLRAMYPRLDRIKESVYARVRVLLYMVLKVENTITGAYYGLQAYPEDADFLGFKGGVLPSYETIRDFINGRVTDELVDRLFDIFIVELDSALEQMGIIIGERRGQDATIIRAKRNDKEAEYNGYYKDKGYKKDIVLDLNTDLPLSYTNLGINEDEGKCLIPSYEKLKQLGLICNEMKVDGKYATYENIASMGVNHIELKYPIAKGWVWNEKGTLKEIQRIYQKYWKEFDFNPKASLNKTFKFLMSKGRYEPVGAYYRNERMAIYEEVPDSYLDDYHERNKDEWFNSYVKEHLGFDFNLPKKGKKAAFRWTSLCLLAITAVALTRVKNGVTENIGSTVYLK